MKTPKGGMIKTAKNLFCLLLAFLAFLFHVLYCFVIIELMYLLEVPRKYKEPVYRFMKVFTHHAVVSVLGFWFPNPIYIKYSSKILASKRSIVISNHCSDYDWLFVGQSMLHLKHLHSLCIMMKQSLAKIPLIGPTMKLFGHLFLNRRRDKDVDIIDNHMKLLSGKEEYAVLIFPEGTYTYAESCKRARQFAEKTKLSFEGGRYLPNRVLLPRKLGFSIACNRLGDTLEGVIDFTLLMNPYMKMPTDECSLADFLIHGTKTINQAIVVSYIPREKITENFLGELFYRKDRILETYAVKFGGRIRSSDEFARLLDEISPIAEDDKVDVIYMTSPYRLYFLVMPLLLVILWILAVLR